MKAIIVTQLLTQEWFDKRFDEFEYTESEFEKELCMIMFSLRCINF